MDFVFNAVIGICVGMIFMSLYYRNWLAWAGWFVAMTMTVATYLSSFGV